MKGLYNVSFRQNEKSDVEKWPLFKTSTVQLVEFLIMQTSNTEHCFFNGKIKFQSELEILRLKFFNFSNLNVSLY